MSVFSVVSGLSLVSPSPSAELPGLTELSVIASGRLTGTVRAFREKGVAYVDAAQACRAYGGQPTSYQVTGRLFCSFKGRQLRLVARESAARLEGREVRLPGPVLVREGDVWAPMALLEDPAFVALVGRTTAYDRDNLVLEVESTAGLGDLRHFSYAAKTRIDLEVTGALSWQQARKGVGRFDVVVFGATAAETARVPVGDGRVREVRLEQEAGLARLVVLLDAGAEDVAVKEWKEPRRLVVEVRGHGRAAAAPAPPAAAGGEPSRKRRIVVDAGHGGRDGGAKGLNGVLEKKVVLDVALELARLLEEQGEFEVLLTRDRDVFVPLETRSRIANESGADLFISIHANAHPSRREHGFEVYFLSEQASDTDAALVAQFENSVLGLQESRPADVDAAMILSSLERVELINESALVAGHLAKAVDTRVDLNNRGVKQAQFYVLHWTRAPSVLIEMAYVSHKGDSAKLASRRFRRKLVDSLYSGILAYGRSKGW